VKAAHLESVDDVGEAASHALHEYGPLARLCVLPDGPQTIPYIEPTA